MTDGSAVRGQDEHWTLVETAFAAALDTPPELRESIIASICGNEPARADVRRLLARHDSLSSSSGGGRDFLEGLDRDRAAALLDRVTDPTTIGRYEIIGRLGRGATGVVYLARDPSLDRRVALKLLAPHLSGRPDAVQRFAEEARTASALDHPHIATIHEIGRTDDGRLFITMAYYEGETLRALLGHGRLQVRDAIAIASQLADALAAAHAKGIVHRDVKPENIVLTARGARLVDFGIAKVTGQESQGPGLPVGTIAYMSPEQTRGEDVGHRADLWALGVVLYEMLAGVRPFRGDNTDRLIASIRGEAPASLRALRADVPPRVARAVECCLEKDPGRRYASAEALLADLSAPRLARPKPSRTRRIAVAAGVVAFVTLAALAARSRNAPNARVMSASTLPSTIAVLPFTTVGPALEHAYVADGITDAVVEMLSRLPNVRVAAQASTVRASRGQSDLGAIGARLGVAGVLQGTVEPVGHRVRVRARLVATADRSTIWSGELERDAADVLSLQHDVGSALLTMAQGTVGEDSSGRLPIRPTGDPIAYDLYLRGRFQMERRLPEAYDRAATLFREALARDSTFARAYVGLAEVYMAVQAARPADRYERSKPLIGRALALDSTLASAHRAAGTMAMWYDRDWAAAERHYQRALDLDPSDLSAYHGYAALLSATGHTKEALATYRKVLVLDPLGTYTTLNIGRYLFWERRYDEAIAVVRHVLQMDSSSGRAHTVLGRALLAAGRHEEAIAELRHENFELGVFEGRAMLAYGLGIVGRAKEARAILAEYEARSRGLYVSPVNLAAIHLGLGEIDRALDWLEKVPDDRGTMFFPLADPMYDVLRGMPRFERVLERLDLHRASRREASTSGS